MIVAVVDSGIEENYYKQNDYIVGVKGYVYRHGCVVESTNRDDIFDYNGHGTQCIDLIHRLQPNVQVLSVKVLNEDGKTNVLVLEKALSDLVDSEVSIINLSLSLINEDYSDLQNICSRLLQKGKIVIASAANGNSNSIPAIFNNVLGVKSDYYYDNDYYEVLKDENIQLSFDNSPVFVKESETGFNLFYGNSKATCLASGKVIEELNNDSTEVSIDAILRSLENSQCENKIIETRKKLNRSISLKLCNKTPLAEEYCCKRLGCSIEEIYDTKLLDFPSVDSDFLCGLFDIWLESDWRERGLIHYTDFEWFNSILKETERNNE